jgi:conjugative relaxase-like TrwC/TraI family protein
VIVSVTALGATPDRLRAAARDVVAYLEGTTANDRTKAGSAGSSAPTSTRSASPGAYYSDSSERPGRWRGQGSEALGESVDPDALRRVLLGQDPVSGRQLVSAQGSSGRSANNARHAVDLAPDAVVTLEKAAELIGVDASYLRRLARQQPPGIDDSMPSSSAVPPTTLSTSPTARLAAEKIGGRWMVTGAEVERFMAARRPPQVVIGYDITFSAPKSLSIVWAVGDAATRLLCEEAFEAGVARGVRYLEQNAVWVGRGRNRRNAGGMIAASYRHSTNRELEPQLHEHVVIANMAKGADGRVQTLDGRGLFAHATTAGHLAEAEMQHHCNQRGIAWTPTHRGVANVAGVGDDAIRALSTRREQVLELAGELGATSSRGRQAAALATRASKDTSVNPTDLRHDWRKRLEATGFGRDELRAAINAEPAPVWTEDDSARLSRHLAGPAGVTEQRAIFDRRDVIQAIVDHTGGRLSGDEVEAHADRWLHTEAVIPLATTPAGRELIGREGKVTLAPDVTYFTTPTMIALEESISAAYRTGHGRGAGVVGSDVTDSAIARWEAATGNRLGADQVQMVHAIVGSGDRFQAVVGQAGSGKTAALEVAARAWEAAGYRVIGAAVNGTAAEVLQRSTGIDSRTVAGLVTRLETATTPVLDARTVVIVDEASTLGNRHHARLVHHVEAAGATMRTVGDPHQHGAVEAGGMWNHLVRLHPDRTPRLVENRRQTAPEMDDVRLANADYRSGRIAEAIARLDDNERIVTAPTSSELLDQLAADWYVDHQNQRAHPEQYPSRMIAEHHHERRALNSRAQALLRADGTLSGPGTRIGEARFYVGDQVIARAANRNLHPHGDPKNYVRNGTTGTVIAVDGRRGQERLVVDFASRGPITVPHEWLTEQIRPGITGGLTPAYAVTSHAAQGDTYRAGRMLATDTSATEAVYVGLTRGSHDTRLYTVKREPAGIDTDPQLPRITDPRSATDALAEQLTKIKPTDLATVADPDIARVLYLTRLPLVELRASADPLAQRAADIVADRLPNSPSPLAGHLPTPLLAAERVSLLEHLHAHPPLNLDLLSRNLRDARSIGDPARIRAAERILARSTTANAQVAAATSRLDEIDQILAPRIAAAVQHPARYVIETLGPHPADNADQWGQAQEAIERYRHCVLGLEPHDGPVAENEHAAMGDRPSSPAAALEWSAARGQVEGLQRWAAQDPHRVEL